MSDDAGTTDRGRLIGGRYRVTGTLGHGGMATVYRAVDEQLGREVAVKVFRIGPVDHGERARAEGEIRVLAQLRSPALVTLYDAQIGDADGDSYLVMELVPGTDLATRLGEGPLDRRTAANVGAQVADGLAAVHAAGIVHRDVKPANVLLEPDGTGTGAPGTGATAKLADFGIALLRDSARVTGTGLVMGTAAYLAPEQVTGQEVTGKADVYALGLLLLEALTGRQAFPGSAMESATARLTRAPEIDPSLPVAWRTLLHTMTAQEPGERPTAAEAAERLRALGRVVDEGAAPTQLLPRSGGAGAAAAGGVAGAAAAADDDRTAVLGAAHPDDVATTALPRTERQPAVPVASTPGTGGAGRAGTVPPDRSRTADGGEPTRRRAGLVWTIVGIVVALVVIGVIVALALNRHTPAPAPTDTTSTSSVPSSEPSTVPSSAPSEPAEPSQEPPTAPSAPTEPSQEPSEPTTPAPTVPEATPGTSATNG